MLDGEEVLRFCLKNRVTIEQFFILYLIVRGDFHLPDKQSLGKAYVLDVKQFNASEIEALVTRGFLEDMNSPGHYLPELYMLTPLARKQFADYEMAEQMWESYPLTFPIGERSNFLARVGGDKDELLELYLRKINFSRKKHEFVMQALAIYKEMVSRREINGYKISDWIRMELWDTVMAIPADQKGGDYGKDL